MALEKVKKIWDIWNIEGVILFSLALQAILILFAPFRKRSNSILITLLIWLTYLLADWAAAYGVGLISQTTSGGGRGPSEQPPDNGSRGMLAALWAPFLLLHLGGPDTITAFALEDNELSLRQLFTVGSQAATAVYILVELSQNVSSSSRTGNKLLCPTILVFVAGIIKCFERIRALFLASVVKVREATVQEFPGTQLFPREIQGKDDLQVAFLYSKVFQGMIVDFITDFKLDNYIQGPNSYRVGAVNDSFFSEFRALWNNLATLEGPHSVRETISSFFHNLPASVGSRQDSLRETVISFFDNLPPGFLDALNDPQFQTAFINNMSNSFTRTVTPEMLRYFNSNFTNPEKALKMIEIELNFVYEFFYTKIKVVLSVSGIILRFISFGSIVAALSVFYSQVEKNAGGFNELYVAITYTLFFGAIFLEIISFLMLLFCDSTHVAVLNANCKPLVTPSLSRRWSRSVSRFSWIKYLVRARPIYHDQALEDDQHLPSNRAARLLRGTYKRLIKAWFGGLFKLLDNLRIRLFVVSDNKLSTEFWEFIFHEIQEKAVYVSTKQPQHQKAAKKSVYTSRGDWVLDKWEHDHPAVVQKIRDYTKPSIGDDPRIPLILHILMWYGATALLYHTEDNPDPVPDNHHDQDRHREFSKVLSDYVMYLLVLKPAMLNNAPESIEPILRQTRHMIEHFGEKSSLKPSEVKSACDSILKLDVFDHEYTRSQRGRRSDAVDGTMFPLAVRLARELQKLGAGEKWKMMSQVWVEILAYAASHCKPRTHAQQLCAGGELATVVWALLLHFDFVFAQEDD